MPLVQQQTLSSSPIIRWGLWRIMESEEQLAGLCTADETAYAGRFGTPERRREWLAWHVLLHTLSPTAEAYYLDDGAPMLTQGHIGVSHTRGYAAVIMGEVACAVDIERRDRDFSRAVYRILSDEELENAGRMADGAGLCWCAKEALYKWARRPLTDYRRDIRLETIDPFDDTFGGSVAELSATLYDLSTAELIVIGCAGRV